MFSDAKLLYAFVVAVPNVPAFAIFTVVRVQEVSLSNRGLLQHDG